MAESSRNYWPLLRAAHRVSESAPVRSSSSTRVTGRYVSKRLTLSCHAPARAAERDTLSRDIRGYPATRLTALVELQGD